MFKFFRGSRNDDHQKKSSSQKPPVQDLAELYDDTYNRISEKLQPVDFISYTDKDLIIPLLLVIGDYVQLCKGKDRQKSFALLKPWIQETILYPRESDWLMKSIDFYSEVISDVYIRGEWLKNHDTGPYKDNPVLRCFVAFGDLMVNRLCFVDYKNVPFQKTDHSEYADFEKIMKNEVYNIIEGFVGDVSVTDY